MIRIAAWSVVAFMAALHSAFDFSIGKFPSKSMGHFRGWLGCVFGFSPWVSSEPPVAMVRFFTKPNPALIDRSNLNLFPKSNFGLGFVYHVGM
jgi:hypothetical protein